MNILSELNIPPAVLAGAGASRHLAAQCERLRVQRVLLVTDAFLERAGVLEEVSRPLVEAGIGVAAFPGVQPDPTDENVAAGLAVFRRERCDAVIALGGGSPIDCGKAIAVMATNNGALSDYQGYHRIPRPGAPLIAIPTTAGTGSEVTKVAVIIDTARRVKMMMLDRHLLPAVALVDFELTMAMPPALTAHVGIDTLTHGIEAYVSRKAGPLTDPIALSCVRLVARHLETAWREPDNREAREWMMLAATQGGMAFANSSVCLVYGMSRPIGATFHVPHGLSNAVLLPTITRYSLRGAPDRYAAVAREMRCCPPDASREEACQALLTELEDLNRRLQIPRLRECCGGDSEAFSRILEKLAVDALASGSPQNNPVVPEEHEIIALYREAW